MLYIFVIIYNFKRNQRDNLLFFFVESFLLPMVNHLKKKNETKNIYVCIKCCTIRKCM